MQNIVEIVEKLENDWFTYIYSSQVNVTDDREKRFYEEKVKTYDKEIRLQIMRELGYV